MRQKKISKNKQGVPKNAHCDSVLEIYVTFLIDGHQPEGCRTKIKEIMTFKKLVELVLILFSVHVLFISLEYPKRKLRFKIQE